MFLELSWVDLDITNLGHSFWRRKKRKMRRRKKRKSKMRGKSKRRECWTSLGVCPFTCRKTAC